MSLEFATHSPDATRPTPPSFLRGSQHQPDRFKPGHEYSHTATQPFAKRQSTQSSRHPSVSRQGSGSSAINNGSVASSPVQHCRCLRDGVVLLEEVENRVADLDVAAMDSALAYHKDALGGCSSMVQCQCEGHQEKAVLLAFIIDKLSILCESVVEAFLDQVRQPKDRQQFPTPLNFQKASEHSNRSWQTLFLGDYEIDSMVEWAPLIKGLICVQLRRHAQFLAKLKAFTNSFGGSQLTKLSHIEKRIRQMALELQDKAVVRDCEYEARSCISQKT